MSPPTLLIGVALALLIGLSLGLLGGGGSILTLPILVYVMHLAPKTAIAGSLFVVAVTSIVSVLPHAIAGRVRFRTGVLFALPAMAMAWVASKWIAPHVDARILLGGFAVLMLLTAATMIRGRKEGTGTGVCSSVPKLLGVGAVAGFLAGMVGAGGGFLVVPALALVAGLPMAEAVATSLLVIALQSAVAFSGARSALEAPLPWGILGVVAAVAVAGSLLGARLVPYVKPTLLRKSFGYLVLVLGVLQLAQNIRS